jgi:hypothetical protein
MALSNNMGVEGYAAILAKLRRIPAEKIVRMRRRIAEVRSSFLYSYHESNGQDAFQMILKSLENRMAWWERA